MNIKKCASFTVSLWMISNVSIAQNTSDIAQPQKRSVSVELARKLLQEPPESQVDAIELPNPFAPSSFGVAKDDNNKPSRPKGLPGTDKELLAVLAGKLSPTAILFLPSTGEPLLVLGQKKVKVGERISITLEGITFEVEVTAIERTNFTIKYKQEEFTRPLK